jgi:hypothetical protein
MRRRRHAACTGTVACCRPTSAALHRRATHVAVAVGQGRKTDAPRRLECRASVLVARAYGKEWGRDLQLPAVHDEAVLTALEALWAQVQSKLSRSSRVVQVGVTLSDLSRADERQLDMLLNDDEPRRKWENTTSAIDGLNSKYGRTMVSVGPWVLPQDGNTGGKISYTRIPRAEDFW